ALVASLLSLAQPTLFEASHGFTLNKGCWPLCNLFSLPPPPPPQNTMIPTCTSVDQWQPVWNRTSSMHVEGTVLVKGTHAPAPGVTVTLYLNHTKSEPGMTLGTAVTNADGVWVIEGQVPSNVAPSSYQLVANGHAGGPYGGSWSDPAVRIIAGSAIGVTESWTDSAWALQVALTDDTGAPLGNQSITYDAGSGRISTRVDSTGQTTILLTKPTNRSVTIAYAGTPNYRGSQTTITLTAPPFSLAEATLFVPVGGTPTIRGTTAPGLTVRAGTATTRADAQGSFSLALGPVEAPLNLTVPVSVFQAQTLETVDVGTVPTLTVTTAFPVYGASVDITGSTSNGPLAGARYVVTVAGPESTSTLVTADTSGHASFRFSASTSGTYTITVTPQSTGVLPAPTTASTRVYTVSDLVAPALAALGAFLGFVLAPLVRYLRRPRPKVTFTAPRRAVATESFHVEVDLHGLTGVVCLSGHMEGPLEARSTAFTHLFERLSRARRYHAGSHPPDEPLASTWTEGHATFKVRPEEEGMLLLEIHIHETPSYRGRTLQTKIRVRNYADALVEAGRTELAEVARWGSELERKAAWRRGGAPA
ncbi:MAG: hypothetical protein ACYDDF_14800, partial [Thermoplasmatota archaeon]